MYHVDSGNMNAFNVPFLLTELCQFSTVNVIYFCNKNMRKAFLSFLKIGRDVKEERRNAGEG